jgi:mercuric reductase
VVVGSDGQEYRAEQLLVATGRRPRTAGLGLEEIGVGVGERAEVLVGADLSTTDPRVWAAGDVTGHPQFVYVAAQHGRAVVANAFDGADRRVDYRSLPRITFTNPTIASAGLTEAQAPAGDRGGTPGPRSRRGAVGDRQPQPAWAGQACGRA